MTASGLRGGGVARAVNLHKAGVSALADAFGRFLKFEFFGERADEEWRVRGGGCEGVGGKIEVLLSFSCGTCTVIFPQYVENGTVKWILCQVTGIANSRSRRLAGGVGDESEWRWTKVR